MKKLAFILYAITLASCCKNIETPEQTATALLMACVNNKELPNIAKGDTWIEGEFNGKYFSMSNNPNFQTKCTLGNFLQLGYRKEYASATEWFGNGLTAFSPDTSAKFNYLFQVNFPIFQGDSIAYLNYFSQFQKGKEFQFISSPEIKNAIKPETIEVLMYVFQCAQTFSIQNGLRSSSDIDQTGSYFRITDVKEYKSASGQVYKRDVTMEFDVKLGNAKLGEKGISLARIKNGRLFFSY
jgi:hypothetical protein